MRLIRSWDIPRPPGPGGAVTIGNFDGVHRGHQHVLRQLADAATALACGTTVVVFEPQPQELFRPGTSPRLTTFREKMTALTQAPVDQVLCLRFDAALAAMDARSFVERVLVGRLGVRHLVVGDDFRFGRGREGDFETLVQAGRTSGFVVEAAKTFVLDGVRVSSTGIRGSLAAGVLEEAERALGRPYAMTGRVRRGDQRGRTLGAPTANIDLRGRLLPVSGVFAVTVQGPRGFLGHGVANAGTRPTVGGRLASLEVHLLDFDGDLYGQRLQVVFRNRLRPELRFASLEALKQQIELDIAQARVWLNAARAVPGRGHG